MYNGLARSRVAPESPASHWPDFALCMNETNAREVFMSEAVNEVVKVCKVHGDLTREQVYKANSKKAKKGFWYTCKSCVITGMWNRDCHKHGKLEDKDRTKDGRCKLCHCAWGKNKRVADPDYFQKRIEESRRNNPEKWTKMYKKNYAREAAKLDAKGLEERATVNLLNKFKLTKKEYENKFIEQNNRCKICGNEEKALTKGGIVRRLSIDHDHVTGEIRGLLCHKCNVLLGNASDSIEILVLAASYLSEYGKEFPEWA